MISLRRHAGTIVVAMVTAAVTAAAPAVADLIADYAWDSDKVDGFHAMASTPAVANRKGKLVATNATTGRLPNNIIALAPNADRVDGRHAAELLRVAGTNITANLGDWDGSPIVDSATIDAPAAGFLLFTYAFNFGRDANATADGVRYYAATPRVDGVAVDAPTPAQFATLDFSCGAAVGCSYETLVVQRLVPVDVGAHTVEIEVAASGGPSASALAFVFERSLSVLYVPFDGTGLVPAPALPAGRVFETGEDGQSP